ncbi:MAG: peptidase S1 [Hyphomonadaceae bacterium]
MKSALQSWIRGAAGAAVFATTAGGALAQDFHQNPTYGMIQLRSGFTPDPFQTNLQSGGSTDAAQSIGGGCTGWVATAPDYRLNYTPGSLPLIISVNSDQDTTLVINGPDGKWYCDDDGGQKGLNPAVRFEHPAAGQYDIWVGTYGSGQLFQSTLFISELTSQ